MQAIPRMLWTLGLALLVGGPASGLTVAGFGDSLTHSPDYLQHLPAEWQILDFGKPGEAAWEGIDRLRGLLPTFHADAIIILEGTNDVRRWNYTNERSLDSLTDMVDVVLAAGMSPVLAAAPPIFHADADVFNERLAFLAGELTTFAAGLGVPFVNLYDDFLALEDPAAHFLPDGVHPGTLGREFIASRIEPAVLRAVPEPSAALLLGAGLGLLALARR